MMYQLHKPCANNVDIFCNACWFMAKYVRSQNYVIITEKLMVLEYKTLMFLGRGVFRVGWVKPPFPKRKTIVKIYNLKLIPSQINRTALI